MNKQDKVKLTKKMAVLKEPFEGCSFATNMVGQDNKKEVSELMKKYPELTLDFNHTIFPYDEVEVFLKNPSDKSIKGIYIGESEEDSNMIVSDCYIPLDNVAYVKITKRDTKMQLEILNAFGILDELNIDDKNKNKGKSKNKQSRNKKEYQKSYG